MTRRRLLLFVLLAAVTTLAGTLAQKSPPAIDRDPGAIAPATGSTDELRRRAEALFAEGSYALAHAIYRRLDERELPAAEARWVDFRLADTQWRAQAATRTVDSTALEAARRDLEALIRDVDRVEDRDRVWVEVRESLGDYHWIRADYPDWGQAWQHYEQALDWWAGSQDLELARQRYLAIVWRVARPPQAQPYYYYGYFGNQLPLDVLENVLEIARDVDGRAHAHYLIAMTLRYQGGDPGANRRTRDAFEAALDAGRSTDWYDDALYHYAEWLAGTGRLIRLESGGYRQQPDYVRAVELFRRLLREFAKGETRYWDQAKAQVDTITGVALGVSVSNIFLPGSEIQYHLSWRNVKQVSLALYPVRLTEELRFTNRDGASGWLERLVATRAATRTWTRQTKDAGDHVPGSEALTLDGDLPVGAYVLEASAAGKRARELVLVTRGALILKSSGRQALVWVCDAVDGSPRADAEVALWVRSYHNREWTWQKLDGRTGADGTLRFELPDDESRVELFAASAAGEHQAFGVGYGQRHTRGSEPWKLYVFTDRPAYRPDEDVRWKLIARREIDGAYVTPAGETLRYRILDPRGTTLEEDTLELNRFGSAWSELTLGAELPLGNFQIQFLEPDRDRHIGGAVLFRMEEYKLPEFKVAVETPRDDAGRPRTFRVGDAVEAEVVAEYYFGGPVAGASVELLVYQKPLWVTRPRPRPFPWFYDDMRTRPWYGGGPGQVIERRTLTTDAEGRATVRFDTPAGSGQDFEYTVEARVTDASRREVVGSGAVRVTRQRHFVFVEPAHLLYRPQDEVRVEIAAVDANEQPVAVAGRVRVTRDRWIEVWIDPAGREVRGAELERVQRRLSVFPPPPPRPGDPGWRLKFSGYEHDELFTRRVTTDDEGRAELSFTPDRTGYYRVAWSSDEDEPWPVNAETTVWVADERTTDLGYRPGGVQVLVDQDTLRAGRTAPVMLSAPVQDSWVLFSVEGEEIYDYRVVHLKGRVKLLQLEIDERHVPNVFLEAAMVRDAELSLDSRQVVVPPVDHFLEVAVETDREHYEPGDEGELRVTTRDHDGNPVAAEVALALVDESVFYIQQDYAGDPRQFFFGDKRGKHVWTQSTFQVKPYRRLVQGEAGLVVDERVGVAGREDSSHYLGDRNELKKAGASRAAGALEQVSTEADAVARFRPSAPAPMEMKEGAATEITGGPVVQVRTDFRSTAFWQPDVVTGSDGRGRVTVKFPDSLTSWKATARVNTAGSAFGVSESATRTRKPLIVRLQAPRFFVVGDEVTLSAVLNNNTEQALDVGTRLDAAGLELLGVVRDGRATGGADATVRVAAGGEARVDWRVAVRQAGEARLQVEAEGGAFADAMARSYAVHEHGVEKFLARSGKVRGDDVRVAVDLPRERRPGSTEMIVQVTPSMAVTMLDALPYLIDYPYGCTEQTMSRFLPSAITMRTLQSLGLDPRLVAGRIFGGIERSHVDKTQPRGEQDLKKLDEMMRQGLNRLYDFQHGDGGWGWWKEGDSDHFMSAYVVWGLGVARDGGGKVNDAVLRRGIDFLDRELVEQEEHPDMQAWMLHALSSVAATERRGPSRFQTTAFDNLWARRDRLNAYTRALLALSAHHFGDGQRALTLVRNLENGVKRDRTPDRSVIVRGTGGGGAEVLGTAHWGEDGIYWRWSDGGVEATAFVLRALLAIDPQNALIEPVTNWLVKNRRGAQWSSTRDTAIVVLALTDYLRTSGELDRELEFEIQVNGRTVATSRLGKDDILGAPSRFRVDDERIRDGANEVRIVRRAGSGPIYFAVETRFFSLEEPITAAGNEIFARRQYHKLTGRPTLLKGLVYEKQPLNDGGNIKSGERVEVVVTIEAKNDYEYLVFEDLKPAGLEAVQLRSGEPLYVRELKSSAVERSDGTREPQDYTGRQRWVYQELRDRKVALFVDKLPEGVWEIRYELRAETPGQFHALPLLGHAMYVPEIRANSHETRLTVTD